MRIRPMLLLVISLSCLAANPVLAAKPHAGSASRHATMAGRPIKPAEQALYNGMRKLWEDHITWTRLYIVSAVARLPDKPATTARLLQNQVDIGNAVKPFYGDAAGDQLTALLKEHILIAAEIVDAAQTGDTGHVNEAAARWYVNADQIAGFLSRANPLNWPADEMREMMHRHLDRTLQEAVAQLQGDYTASVSAYDQVHADILEMADMLSRGIINQFPNRFR